MSSGPAVAHLGVRRPVLKRKSFAVAGGTSVFETCAGSIENDRGPAMNCCGRDVARCRGFVVGATHPAELQSKDTRLLLGSFLRGLLGRLLSSLLGGLLCHVSLTSLLADPFGVSKHKEQLTQSQRIFCGSPFADRYMLWFVRRCVRNFRSREISIPTGATFASSSFWFGERERFLEFALSRPRRLRPMKLQYKSRRAASDRAEKILRKFFAPPLLPTTRARDSRAATPPRALFVRCATWLSRLYLSFGMAGEKIRRTSGTAPTRC